MRDDNVKQNIKQEMRQATCVPPVLSRLMSAARIGQSEVTAHYLNPVTLHRFLHSNERISGYLMSQPAAARMNHDDNLQEDVSVRIR